jgi:hypothetical protein
MAGQNETVKVGNVELREGEQLSILFVALMSGGTLGFCVGK